MTIPITGQPEVPDLSDPATFNTKALNLFTWITGSMLDQFNNVNPADWFGVQSDPTDATPGRVMLTGAGGLMESGASRFMTNINATNTPGSLARFGRSTAGTKPPGVGGGTVLTMRGGSTNYLSQMVVSIDGQQLWFRACQDGVWKAWRQAAPPAPPAPPELTQAQAVDGASTVFGQVSGERLRQAVRSDLNAVGVAPIYACRAWVNFDGTDFGTVAIRASGNVSSVTDIAVGTYRVNFAARMLDNGYAATANWTNGSLSLSEQDGQAIPFDYDTESLRISLVGGGTSRDGSIVSVAVFR